MHQPVSKYAYLYSATSIKEGIPSFSLACIGSDNKFTTIQVLMQWKYIYSQLAQQGMRVLSFAADVDSHLLSAMKVTYRFSPDTSALSLTRSLKSLDADPTIQKWLCSKLYPLLCTQDIVHLGVKLKSRLLNQPLFFRLANL